MCGIAGFWGAPDRALLAAMAEVQCHRGPDDDTGRWRSWAGPVQQRYQGVGRPSATVPRPGRKSGAAEQATLAKTSEGPAIELGITHWSSRSPARQIGCSNVTIANVWRKCAAAAVANGNLPILD